MDGHTWFNNEQPINCFLGYRCIYGDMRVSGQIRSAASAPDIQGTRRELINKGVDTLTSTFELTTDECDDDVTHVLPLSGGLDSRTILGGLLNNIPAEEIVTVTFGTPDTWDFEIGRRVAHEAGTQHFTVDLRPESFPGQKSG